ncbi:hypothetical protein [Bacillus cereus]|uniref:hypothetical protein n=1 Tax=Bacillus cereus TaxID=1396 RepID=UPI003814646B
MKKIGLLSINEAKRKNEQQSANVYIVEQQFEEQQHEQPVEHPTEHQNTVSKETENNKQKTLNNTYVNNKVIQNDVMHDEYVFAKKNGISKKLFCKVVDEVKSKSGISNIGAYIRGAINNIINYISFRNGTRTYENPMSQLFYDCLNDNGHETV